MPSWKVPSALPEWLEKFFYIEDPVDPVTGDLLPPGPIRLFPHQRRILTAMTERDGNGRFRWTTLLYSTVKKSGKTRLAAGIVAWLAAQYGPYAECYVLANDGKQSDDRLLSAVRKANNLNKVLDWHESKRAITLPDGSFIEAIPVDPEGESGANPTAVVFSELWGYGLQYKERFWATMTISPAKHGRSLRVVETYAGYEGESPTLERLYEQGVTLGKRHPDFPDLPVFINESAGLITYWDEEPRMPWQTDAYYAQEASMLPHNEFLRLHRNQWVRSEDTFVPVAWWDSLKENLPPLQKGEKIIIGADAAVSGACFGLVAVTRHWDPKRKGTDVAIRLSRKWAPPRGGKIDFAAKDGPEETVREWAKDYRVLEVAYDQYQLHRTATQMNQERVCFWKPFGQQTDRLISDSQLYHLIRDGRLAHDGNTDLREHLQHCNAKTAVGEDTKMRIVQRNANSPIDLMVAAGMAAKRCLELRM